MKIMANEEFQSIQDYGLPLFKNDIAGFTGVERDEVSTGLGDDSSVLETKGGQSVTTSTEIFLEGVHFDLTYTPFHHLGYKLVTAAVSDIYAMNIEPVHLHMDVAAPNRYSVQMLKDLYKGVDAACKDYNIQLAGTDVTASHQILVLSATATGLGNKEKVVRQSGAKQDHIICVTGDLGAAIAGLRILLREKSAWKEGGQNHFQPDLGDYEYVVQRQLVPKARKDLLKGFQKSGITPSSLTDVTRGVVNDLQQIGKQSEMGIEIYSPAIPISYEVRNVADEMQEDVDKYAFYGGEDYEMAFTISEEEVEKLKADFDDFSVIGKMVEKEKQFIINTGEGRTIKFDLFET